VRTTNGNTGVNSQIPLGNLGPIARTSCAIDWITATTKSEDCYEFWLSTFNNFWSDTYPEVAVPEQWEKYGYKGVSLPGFAISSHKINGTMVRLSGLPANELWRDILSYVEVCNVTRIDLCVTVDMSFNTRGHASEQYAAILADRVQPHIGKRLITDNEGGETLYIGSRTSQIFLRLYDKSAEQGDKPGWSWRYEIEYKKPVSLAVAKLIMDNAGGDDSLVREAIANTVYDAFHERGVSPLFDADGAVILPTVAKRKESPVSRQLKWLGTSVRPAIQRLIKSGYKDAVLEILGLDVDK